MFNMTTQKNYPSSSLIESTAKRTWVQTERASHEAWMRLTLHAPKAAALLHHLTAVMEDDNNAVIVSQATLAKVLAVSVMTIKRAVDHLRGDRWIEVIQIGGKGGANAYIVNDRVAWTKGRNQLHLSKFTATVIADRTEQKTLDDTPLRSLPKLRPGEQQLPSGPGEKPPAQPAIEGLETDLPTITDKTK